MAIPIAAVAAGISALTGAGQLMAQGKTNKKTREWNEMMYGRQRQDALDDWNRVNAYNSPEQQMQRYKEAGLNPNLIYGQTNEAPAVKTPDVGDWRPQTPDVRGISQAAIEGLEAYQDYTLQQEQVKNIHAQRANMEMDTLLKSADLYQKNLSHDTARELQDTVIQTAKENLRAMRTGTDIKVSQELRDQAKHAPSLEKLIADVARTRADTANAMQQLRLLQGSEKLQQLEINLRNLGMSYSDPAILRALAQFSQGKSLPEVVKDIWSAVMSVF